MQHRVSTVIETRRDHEPVIQPCRPAHLDGGPRHPGGASPLGRPGALCGGRPHDPRPARGHRDRRRILLRPLVLRGTRCGRPDHAHRDGCRAVLWVLVLRNTDRGRPDHARPLRARRGPVGWRPRRLPRLWQPDPVGRPAARAERPRPRLRWRTGCPAVRAASGTRRDGIRARYDPGNAGTGPSQPGRGGGRERDVPARDD